MREITEGASWNDAMVLLENLKGTFGATEITVSATLATGRVVTVTINDEHDHPEIEMKEWRKP